MFVIVKIQFMEKEKLPFTMVQLHSFDKITGSMEDSKG
jgi:hypothetical protein